MEKNNKSRHTMTSKISNYIVWPIYSAKLGYLMFAKYRNKIAVLNKMEKNKKEDMLHVHVRAQLGLLLTSNVIDG